MHLLQTNSFWFTNTVPPPILKSFNITLIMVPFSRKALIVFFCGGVFFRESFQRQEWQSQSLRTVKTIEMHLKYQVIGTSCVSAVSRGGEAACPRVQILACVFQKVVFKRWVEIWGLCVHARTFYLCFHSAYFFLLSSREHDRADISVMQQPAGSAGMGGPPTEADEGHICGKPHHKASFGAVSYRKDLALLLLPDSRRGVPWLSCQQVITYFKTWSILG